VEGCVQRLRAAILAGEPPAGAMLPPERALAAELGVNRTTLRAAIQRLGEMGLVAPHQGRGTVVRDFRAHASVDVLVDPLVGLAPGAIIDLPALARDLLAVRRAIARVVLEALVEAPPDEAALTPVRSAVARFAEVVGRGPDVATLAAADLEVLGAVVDATGRPGLRLCMNPVARTLAALPRLAAAIHVDPPAHVAAFHAMVRFLEAPRAGLVEPLLALLAARDDATLERLRNQEPPSATTR
jgi:GntR family transcriptional repressor for pyruvate dehydrogenase complex